MLIWLWFFGYQWMPPIAFSSAVQHPEKVHIVKVTAGQWFWRLEDGGTGDNNTNPLVVLRQVGGVLIYTCITH